MEEHFESEVIEKNGVLLTDDEEAVLEELLEKFVERQLTIMREQTNSTVSYNSELAIQLAGLAFVAGRSYQSQFEDGPLWTPEPSEDTEGMVPVYLEPATAGRLIARLLGD